MRIPIQVLIYPVRKIDEDWEYLMLKRIKSRGGFWQGVTGAPENNETLTESAKRELYEETGYNPLNLIKTDISYTIPMEDRWKDIYPEGTKEIPEYLFIAMLHQPDSPNIDLLEHNAWNLVALCGKVPKTVKVQSKEQGHIFDSMKSESSSPMRSKAPVNCASQGPKANPVTCSAAWVAIGWSGFIVERNTKPPASMALSRR